MQAGGQRFDPAYLHHRFGKTEYLSLIHILALGIPTVVSSRVLGGTAEEMYVTPREIDQLINRGAKLLGMSINVWLQRHLQPRDLYTLVG